MGFTFAMLSDPEMQVIDTYGLRNPEVPDLALHAVYVIDRDRKGTYRKIARRRVKSPEILLALGGAPAVCCPGGCSGIPCQLRE